MADAGYRLAVEGEKEFKKALSEINAQIKASKSELKLLTAEYEINDDKLSGLQKTQSALADTMAQQAEKVKIAEERYRAWADELGDGDEKVLKLKEALNLAKTELAKSTAEWQKNQKAIDEYGKEGETTEEMLRKVDAALAANRSEIELVAAQYKSAGDKSEMFRQKGALLEDSVSLQRQKVGELSEALQRAEQEYGDNAEAVLDLKRQLADANTELIGMEDQLEENNREMREGGDAADPMREALSDIANKLGIDIPPGIEKVSTKILGAAVAAGGIGIAIKEGIELMKEMASYADDVLTESVISGIDTQVYQQIKYMDGLMDVSTDTVTSTLSRIKRAMDDAANGSEELEKKFRTLGVAVTDQNGNLRDSWEVYLEVIDALGSMRNETERDAIAMDLMGRSAGDLNPLIEAGADRMQELADEAERVGYVLSDEQLASAGGFQDVLDKLTKTTEGLKNNIGLLLIETIKLGNGNGTLESVKSAWDGVKDSINGAMEAIGGENENLDKLKEKWKDFWEVVSNGGRSKKPQAMTYSERMRELQGTVEEVTESIEKMDGAVSEIPKKTEEATEYATEQTEKLVDAAEKAYEAEIKAAQKAADEKLKAYQKSLNAELDALDERHAAELKAVEKNNAALLKSVQKSQKERQKALEASLDAEMEALEAQHREKLALIDAEYAERMKLLDNDQRKAITDIDAEIEAIEAVTAAEEAARKEKKQQEEIAALEKAVSEAQSREEKEEAERELSEYLLELERERILAEREANIAALEAKKELLEAEYDAQKEEIEAEKAATIEGLEAEFDAEKSLLETQHQERRDMLAEELALELDVYRENMSARVDELRKEQKNERDVLAESIAERVGNYKEEVQKEVDAEKEAAEDRLEVAKKNAEDMMVVWEDYYMKFKAILDSSAAEARAAGEKFATEFAGGIGAAMLAQEKSEGFAEGRLARGALMQGMNSGDFPDLAAAQNYTAAVAGQLSQAGGALNAGTGTVYNYNVTVEAKNIKELNDIVRLVENERMDTRMR